MNSIIQLKEILDQAEAVVIGAGAGLSTSAGLHYSGERFEKAFPDFIGKFGLTDMYSSAFYNFPDLETKWAYWSRHILMNRYEPFAKNTYQMLLELVKDKNYFVITTNGDHGFLRSGFDQNRLFYTQGDYGLWQCPVPCHKETYENEEIVKKMVAQQENMRIPSELIPYCPRCGKPMTPNLRCDETFVEPDGWHNAYRRYEEFLKQNEKTKVLYLEIGIGANTPSIIKYPFWQFTTFNPNATYACLNYGQSSAPARIADRSICLNADAHEVIELLLAGE